jgi:predicted alpha/beta-fold hydrolase
MRYGGDIGNVSELEGSASLRLEAGGSRSVTFTPTQDVMANFWIEGMEDRDITLRIEGAGLPSSGYVSGKTRENGESISLRLQEGVEYRVTVQDSTPWYGQIHNGHVVATTSFDAELEMQIEKYSSGNIQGRMSIEGSNVTMPVGMSVARFDAATGERIQDPNLLPSLDPTKPVWVVVHGRTSNERSDNIEDLAKAIDEYSKANNGSYQVVTIDWEEAAKDIGFIDRLRDANWTPAVGQWAARQLASAGYSGSNINFIGHSHGAYVSYYAAEEFNRLGRGTTHSIVALDPATSISGYPDEAIPVNFAQVAETSLAIKAQVDNERIDQLTPGSDQLLSRAVMKLEYGSDYLSKTAHTALQIEVPNEVSKDRTHGYPITAFAATIRESIGQGSGGAIANSPLGLQHILNTRDGMRNMNVARGFDGTMIANGYQDEIKSTWWKATPVSLDLAQGTDIVFHQ